MKKEFEYYNELAKEVVNNYNTWLNPVDVVLNPSMETAEHITISSLIPTELGLKIQELVEKFLAIDESLIIKDPSLYHFTVYWCPIGSDVEGLRKILVEEIEKEKLEFDLKGLQFAPLGISLEMFPTNDALINIRQRMADHIGAKYKKDERGVTTWVNLIRYSQIPKIEVKKFVQENSQIDFGHFVPSEIGFYKSKHKNFEGVEELFVVKNN